MSRKTQINFRASPMTRDQLDYLVKITGLNLTEVVTVAIDRMATTNKETVMKKVSIDNGQTYIPASDVPAEWLIGPQWDALVSMMEDYIRERAHMAFAGFDIQDEAARNLEFLKLYLQLATDNLTIC